MMPPGWGVEAGRRRGWGNRAVEETRKKMPRQISAGQSDVLNNGALAREAALARLDHYTALLDAQREHRELTELIVHDLKAPLSIVRAGLEWVGGQLRPDQFDVADALADASAAADRLSGMIGDLLTMSQLDGGVMPVRRQQVSVRRLFDLIARGYARRAREKRIAIETTPGADSADSGPTLEITADPGLLQRVLENIVENALRYTPTDGRIALSAHAAGRVEIAVSNDGPTIPIGDRVRIFNKFARGESEPARSGSAGLGLYFCRRVVEAHGGDIAVVESDDWPTSFRITLPEG
jgi:signal transduction histidine kinase